ncbi:uncharacterized protein F4822DRAFT_426711 [Hypoxylon trugodes]|uniref:uncharacterized protein n=1 Tax=Hypoxylon trugodes TaxID=326681 RepID=UPI0021939AD4|nr:uncharacterized protein F4822DRAFT_426711 [Hypoxylon trugodes]KAI1390864.1 hypothetical protein F4822DRAFT_426711 [Hypoxylon trugodes]
MQSAGVSIQDLLKVRHYIVNYEQTKLGPLMEAMASVFGIHESENLPASLLVSVPSLADPRFFYEVEATAAISGARSITPEPAAPALQDVTETDVVVVGAGLSGLQAAVDLQSGGLRTLILEATDCVGGRTFSVNSTSCSSNKVDLGGAWINDTNQSRVWALARKYGMQTVQQPRGGLNIMIQADGSVHNFPYSQLTPDRSVDEEHIIPFILAVDELAKTIDPKRPENSPNSFRHIPRSIKQQARSLEPCSALSQMN